MKNTQNSAGNAFVIVLILIALLAALTVTLTRMGSSTQDVSQEQANVIASQVLRQGRSLANSVDGLIGKGCSVNQLSFDNSTVTGYTNAQSPSDKSCWIFDQAGAGMAFPLAPSGSSTSSIWHFSRSMGVAGVGKEREGPDTTGAAASCPTTAPNCADIIAVFPFVNVKVCQAINVLAGVTTSYTTAPPQQIALFPINYNFSAPSAAATVSNFSAAFNNAGLIMTNASPQTNNPFWDKKTGCLEAANGYRDTAGNVQTGTGVYFVYQVLLER